MTDILDELEKRNPTQLSKNWNDLRILISLIVLISGIVCLYFGSTIQIELYDNRIHTEYPLIIKIKFFTILTLAPTLISISGILLLLKKRLGWLGSLTSAFILLSFLLFVGVVNREYNFLFLLGSCFSFAIMVLLFNKEYRQFFQFKAEHLFFIFGLPIIIFILVFIIR